MIGYADDNRLAPLLADDILHRMPRPGIGSRVILAGAAVLVCAAALEPHRNVWAQASTPARRARVTLFENVRIFDGKGAALSTPANVLIRGNVIERISTQPIPVDRRADTRIIDGGGRTLMPGLIDVHWHAMLARMTPAQAFGDVGYNNLVAGDEATDTLMRGFTTVRDVGGPVFGLKRAIDEGIVKGPRIYPSGAMITVTSGHGDFRQLTDLPRTIGGMLTRMEQIGGAMVADSPDEVRVRVREQLMQGASRSS
jgi:imidazolonepropionase-like amidohydrolase